MDFTPGNTYEISRNGKSFSYRFSATQWDEFDSELILIFASLKEDGRALRVSGSDLKTNRYTIKELIAA
jgi:hypothetical protein